MINNTAIVGGGIAGLTLSVALKRRGIKNTVFESAAELKPVGAGIIMANNAMQIFKKMGIDHEIASAGNRISSMNITDKNLKLISVMELTAFEKKYGVFNVAIHRSDLITILAKHAGFENIQMNKRLRAIQSNQSGFELNFEDQSASSCAFLFGADGIHSKVRQQLFKENTLRSTAQMCWRGVCKYTLPEMYLHQAFEAWGKGKRFGFVKINDNQVYWYALKNIGKKSIDHEHLLNVFYDFHPEIKKILEATPKENIIQGELMDLAPIHSWHKPNVCLLGDAAHATTPNLGQGANQAIEDVYAIAKLLDAGTALNSIGESYQKMRIKKAHRVVNTSRMLGSISQYENALAIAIRNFILKSTPASVNRNQLEWIFDIE